jgi:hypothetical protein
MTETYTSGTALERIGLVHSYWRRLPPVCARLITEVE